MSPGRGAAALGAEGRGVRAECCLNKSVLGKSGAGAGEGSLREDTRCHDSVKMCPFCCLDPFLSEDLSPPLWALFNSVSQT